MHIKLPKIFTENAGKNNEKVLKALALEKPLIVYNIYKTTEHRQHTTVMRRVNDLVSRGYIKVQRRVKTKIGKSPAYELTLKGFVLTCSLLNSKELAKAIENYYDELTKQRITSPTADILMVGKKRITRKSLAVDRPLKYIFALWQALSNKDKKYLEILVREPISKVASRHDLENIDDYTLVVELEYNVQKQLVFNAHSSFFKMFIKNKDTQQLIFEAIESQRTKAVGEYNNAANIINLAINNLIVYLKKTKTKTRIDKKSMKELELLRLD